MFVVLVVYERETAQPPTLLEHVRQHRDAFFDRQRRVRTAHIGLHSTGAIGGKRPFRASTRLCMLGTINRMVLIAALLSASAPAARTPSPQEAAATSVERSAAMLAPHIKGTWLDKEADTGSLAEAHWRAVRDWAGRWLDAHHGSSPAAMTEAGTRFGDGWTISAVALGRGDVLVTASHDQIGTTFILGQRGRGGRRTLWSITQGQTALDPEADHALAQWRPEVQNASCPTDCRMIGGAAGGRLPNSSDGASRFWVDACYAQEAGTTIGGQLSVWSWRGGSARPLLVRDFTVMAEQPGPVLRGSTLHVSSKGSWTSIFACGSCFGRETDLPFAFGPIHVRALPPVSRTPEIDLVDRVFSKVLAHQPTGALASPSAARVIRRQLAHRLAEPDPELRTFAGMVMGWSRRAVHGQLSACLAVDGVGATFFAFNRALSRITAARALDDNACQGGTSRM